jgi:hypothetical protein
MLKSIRKIILPTLILALILALPAQAQWGEGPGKGPGNGPKSKEKISMIKKMKMLEVLDLDEKTSDKFLAKYSVWEDKIQEKMETIGLAADELENSIRANHSKDEITKRTAKLQQEQRDFSNLLFQAQEDIKTILNEVQFAKYVLFEHKFKSELQKMIMKRMKNRGKDQD